MIVSLPWQSGSLCDNNMTGVKEKKSLHGHSSWLINQSASSSSLFFSSSSLVCLGVLGGKAAASAAAAAANHRKLHQ
jgi:hypothetical protein